MKGKANTIQIKIINNRFSLKPCMVNKKYTKTKCHYVVNSDLLYQNKYKYSKLSKRDKSAHHFGCVSPVTDTNTVTGFDSGDQRFDLPGFHDSIYIPTVNRCKFDLPGIPVYILRTGLICFVDKPIVPFQYTQYR